MQLRCAVKRELWRTDGTNGGTLLVKEIISGGVGDFKHQRSSDIICIRLM